jgi:hypothetical protein
MLDQMNSSIKGVGHSFLCVKPAFGLVACFFSADSLYTEYVERQRIPRIVKAFERGSNLHLSSNRDYFPREKLEEEMAFVIAPSITHTFSMITGAYGTGKTTCVKQVCHKIGSGVIYIYLSENDVNEGKVYEVLARKLDIDLVRSESFWSRFLGKTARSITMGTVAKELQQGALAYY